MKWPLARDRFRWVRIAYIAFHLAALPLVLLALLVVPVACMTWSLRGNGVMEGPEPTEGEVIASMIALSLFTVVYASTFLFSYRIKAPRLAWLPFAAHIPALLWLMILRLLWSSDPVRDRLWFSVYPAVLLLIAGWGIVASLGFKPLRLQRAQWEDRASQ